MSRDPRELAAIFGGGAVGAVLRVALSKAFPSGPTDWPWMIFAINVSGAFILAYVVTRLQERLPVSTYRRPLVGTGFCGAFTTFSTMQLEFLQLLDHGCYGRAASYAAASIVAGYLAISVASALARHVRLLG